MSDVQMNVSEGAVNTVCLEEQHLSSVCRHQECAC